MCYSEGASIAAFMIDILIGTLLYLQLVPVTKKKRSIQDDKLLSYVLFGLASMQLGEFIIHTDPTCTGANQAGSHFAFYSLLFIQPIFSYTGILLHGIKRTFYGFNIVFVVWNISLITYALNASYISVDDDFYSETLGKNVSKWCTTDFECEGFGCPLKWNWDDLNQSWFGYIMYFFLVIFLPIVSVNAWEFWLVVFTLFLIVQTATNAAILRVGAACLWGPILVGLMQYFMIPYYFKTWIRSNSRSTRRNYETVGNTS